MVVCRTVFIMSRDGKGERRGRREGMEERGDRGRDDSIHLILRSSQLMIAMSNTSWLVSVGTHPRLSRNVRKEPSKEAERVLEGVSKEKKRER